MTESKEILASRFYNYLCFDQKSDTEFHNPFSENKQYWERLMQDANELAEIALNDNK